jgi:hypothetical protein
MLRSEAASLVFSYLFSCSTSPEASPVLGWSVVMRRARRTRAEILNGIAFGILILTTQVFVYLYYFGH